MDKSLPDTPRRSPPAASPEVERRALALLERLAGWPGHARFRERLLRRESDAVRARVSALEVGLANASALLPTEVPGAQDGEDGPPPPRIGPYRITDRIGIGGMGAVWKAERDDGLYDQSVAVKLIHAHLLSRAGAAFDAERRILARLEHPSIARLLDGGVAENGLPYLIMEYVDGTPIDEACAALSLHRRIDLFIRAVEAVQFAHSRLVAHADLKPSNILVDRAGQVKLLDFGIARLLGNDGAPVDGPGPMTPGFASPERTAGGGPSIADDVFALGQNLARIVGNSADADLAAITAKARATNESLRYGSVASLVDDLDRWRDKLPVSARTPSIAYRTGKLILRHPIRVAAIAATFVALAVTSVVATTNYVRAEHARAEATARFADARGTARYLLFDVMDRLEQQPHSLRLRADVARVAQHYLDRLSKAEGAAPEVRLEAATGLWRLAEHQAKAGQPNLRQPDAARANLATAAAIAATIPGDPALLLLARIQLDQVMLFAAVDNNAARAEQRLRAAQPTLTRATRFDPTLRAQHLLVVANLRSWQGRYPEVIAAGHTALASPMPRDPRAALLLNAALMNLISEGFFYLGNLPQAELGYRTVMAQLTAARARWPTDNFILGRLARARWNLGSTLEEMKRFADALPILAHGVAEARQALAFDPADEDAARLLRILESTHAQALAYLGQTDAALAVLRRYVEGDRQLWLAHPNEPSRLRDYAASAMYIGEAQAAGGRRAEGCRSDADTLALFAQLRRMDRLMPSDVDHNIALVKQRLARNCSGGP